jgi:hypothetical protein
MNDWENPEFWHMLERIRRLQEHQRQIDEVSRMSRQIDELTKVPRLIDQISSRLPEWDRLLSVQQAIEEVHRLRQSPAHQVIAGHGHQIEQMLRWSVEPFPDLRTLSRAQPQAEFFDAYDNLNLGLADASLLGEVELENEEPDERDAVEVESQLIEVVPAEALDSLRRVGFVPFSLLSKVVARPKTLFELTSRTFEEFVAELVSRLGIEDVLLTPERADGGRDVIGTTRILGIPLILAFECKRYAPNNPVSVETARALLGTITHGDYRADRGVLVTTSRFTGPARQFIVTSPVLEGRDFNGIVDWLGEFAKLQRGRAD